jgi:ubiquinone/menaquinone biosynthesis C-methylase UbiE
MENRFLKKVENLDDFYKKEFKWPYTTISGYKEFPSIRKQKIILELVNKIKPELILDVGCGGGIFVRELKNKFKIFGCDISLELILSIPKENSKKKNFLVCRAEKLPFKKENFDLVICSELLEHLKEIDFALLEIYRVLKKKGYLIVTVPNLYCYDSLEGKLGIVSKIINLINIFRKILKKEEIYKYGYNTHINKFTPGEWENILSKNKFKVLSQRAIFISPYIPQIFGILKKIENFIYTKKFFFDLQEHFEEIFCKIPYFNKLGQLHLFLCRKN